MVIRVLDHKFFVEQTLPSSEGLVQYVCSNVSEDDGRVYRIVRIPLEEVKPALVEYLADIYREGLFRELVQYANEAGYLHVVTDCGLKKAIPLAKKLQEETLPLAERLAMGENLIRRLILSNVPAFFGYGAMDPEHVCFTDADECFLVYDLEHLEQFDDYRKDAMIQKIREVLGVLFARELQDGKIPEMKKLLDRIRQKEFSGLLNLYQSYKPVAEALAAKDENHLEPKSLLWRMWELIKSLAGLLKRFVVLLAFCIAIAYLVFSIRNFLAVPKPADTFHAVGDLEILSGTRSTEETENDTFALEGQTTAAGGSSSAASGTTAAGSEAETHAEEVKP